MELRINVFGGISLNRAKAHDAKRCCQPCSFQDEVTNQHNPECPLTCAEEPELAGSGVETNLKASLAMGPCLHQGNHVSPHNTCNSPAAVQPGMHDVGCKTSQICAVGKWEDNE